MDVFLVGNTANHHLNDDYVMNNNFVRRAADGVHGTYDTGGRAGETRRAPERRPPERNGADTRRAETAIPRRPSEAEREERTSTMAGLGSGSEEGRVRAWMRYVEEGGDV